MWGVECVEIFGIVGESQKWNFCGQNEIGYCLVHTVANATKQPVLLPRPQVSTSCMDIHLLITWLDLYITFHMLLDDFNPTLDYRYCQTCFIFNMKYIYVFEQYGWQSVWNTFDIAWFVQLKVYRIISNCVHTCQLRILTRWKSSSVLKWTASSVFLLHEIEFLCSFFHRYWTPL